MELRWNIGQRVTIKELKVTGVVMSIWIVQRGVSYEVRYFHNGEAKSVYFFSEELEQPRVNI